MNHKTRAIEGKTKGGSRVVTPLDFHPPLEFYPPLQSTPKKNFSYHPSEFYPSSWKWMKHPKKFRATRDMVLSRNSGLGRGRPKSCFGKPRAKVQCCIMDQVPKCCINSHINPRPATQRRWASPPLKTSSRHVCTGTCFIQYCRLSEQIGDK